MHANSIQKEKSDRWNVFGDSFWGIRWDLWELVRLSTSRDQRVCIKGQADGEIGSMMDSGRRGRNLKIVSG